VGSGGGPAQRRSMGAGTPKRRTLQHLPSKHDLPPPPLLPRRCKRDTTCVKVCKPSPSPPMSPNRPPLPRKPPTKRTRPPGYWEDSWANGRRRRALRGSGAA
jgi:hypothetical protein